MKNWPDFLGALNELPWHTSDEVLDPLVLSILAQVVDRHDIWRARLREVANDSSEFRALQEFHNFPRLLMDKFVIYCDPEDRFRVRLHRFNSQDNTGGAQERIHSHKWPGYTLILKGQLIEDLFVVEEIDEKLGFARIQLTEKKLLSSGTVDAKKIGVPHRVINPSHTESAYTLFIRGPARHKAGLIFDDRTSRCWPWLGAIDSLRKGMEIFDALSDEFI